MQQLLRNTFRAGQSGVSLLEVLIAAFVMSFGVLGAASLLVTSKQGNHEALQRSQAAQYTNALLERMRGNTAALATYTGDGAGQALTAVPTDEPTCVGACTAQQTAQLDLVAVAQPVFGNGETLGSAQVGGLTDPTICINGPAGGNGIYTVAIAWRGMARLSNPVSSSCGEGSGRYGTGSDADSYRRVFEVTTYIGEPL